MIDQAGSKPRSARDGEAVDLDPAWNFAHPLHTIGGVVLSDDVGYQRVCPRVEGDSVWSMRVLADEIKRARASGDCRQS